VEVTQYGDALKMTPRLPGYDATALAMINKEKNETSDQWF